MHPDRLQKLLKPEPPPQASIATGADIVEISSERGLDFPMVRYLPPPGRYFEQFALPDHFNAPRVCIHCYKPKHGQWSACDRACGVCKTKVHQAQQCPLFYCTASWWASKGGPPPYVQIRPSVVQAAFLASRGVILSFSSKEDPVRPNLLHSIVQDFVERSKSYSFCVQRDGSYFILPHNLRQLQCTSGSASRPLIGHHHTTLTVPTQNPAIVATSQITVTESSPQPVANMVNTELDPRRRDSPFLQQSDTQAQAPTISTMKHLGAIANDAESRIQQLEDQVLGLQKSVVLKDREIRQLKCQVEEMLKAQHPPVLHEYNVGNKRLKVEED